MDYQPGESSRRYGWKYIRPESENRRDYHREIIESRNRDYADSIQDKIEDKITKNRTIPFYY
jgi:hypothetical protein